MNLANYKIMVCDDSILFRTKMINYLTELECTSIIEVTDGQEAVDSYKENKPNLVFLDIVMPNKTGIEAAREIIEYDKDAYIIMFSSVGTHKYVKDAIFAGAKDFVQKPFYKDDVDKTIAKFLAGKGEE